MSLTSEQLARIEENRKKALERRALRARIEANRQKALELQARRRKCEEQVSLSAFKTNPSIPGSSSTTSSNYDTTISPGNSDFPAKKAKPASYSQMANTLKPCPNAYQKLKLYGNCLLVSKEHFIVDIKYHFQTVEIFKTVKSAFYDCSLKKWKFRVEDYDTLMKELSALSSEVCVSGIPRKILNLFLNPPSDYQKLNIDLSSIDPHLMNCIMPFQKEGVKFGISRNGRCLIADDMGLGKTIQALGIAHYYKNDWPLLIVCPTSVRHQWMEAVHNWLPSVEPYTVNVVTTGKDFDSSAVITIISYNLVSRHDKIVKSISYGIIIVDESHFLKTYSSARTKSVCNLLKNSKRVILLSGTPALSRPVELFTQLNAIDPVTFSKFQEYGIRYCAGKQTHMGFWDYNGCSNMQELQLVLEQSIMIRRMKSDVMSQLPSKIRQMILLHIGEIGKNKNMKDFEKSLQNRRMTGSERRGTLLQYYAATGKCKLPAIIDYLNDQLESKKKFIIFAHHKVVIQGICETISKQKIDYICIDGSTSSICRKEMCDKFQLNVNCLIAVLSITAANAGITLTAAQLVIFAELFWNPGILTQAEDRAHRIGQKDCVHVQYLVSPGTADDHLWPLIQSKLEVLNKAGLSEETFQACETSSIHRKTDQTTIKNFFSSLDEDDDDILLKAVNCLEYSHFPDS